MLGISSRSSFVVGALLLSIATPASAVVVESVTFANTYSYTFGNTQPAATTGGTSGTFLQSDKRPLPESQLGVDFVGQAAVGSFYFLHNDYCVGACLVSSSTVITFSLRNLGDVAETLRFDSLITPGHLALVGLGSYENTAASFGFTVSRTIPNAVGIPGTTQLYAATGNSGINGISVDSNGNPNPFNNMIAGTNEGAGSYLDWSATALNLEIGTLAPGQTMTVQYAANYTVKSFNKCVDLLNCNAAQVVFGDPRSNGGGTELAPGLEALQDLDVDGGVRPVINRFYDAYQVPYAFVLSGSPLPTQPAPEAALNYLGNYIPNAVDVAGVPEPATWASMTLGFGLIGWMARRRRRAGGRPLAA